MTNRKLKLGIIYTYTLIFIQILFALTFLIGFMADNYDNKKDIIYQISYAYVYVSILILIRKLVIENSGISRYLIWIIRLEILKAIGSVLGDCKDEEEFIDKSTQLINELKIADSGDLEDIFFGDVPNLTRLTKKLDKILDNIAKVKRIPITKRHFDF